MQRFSRPLSQIPVRSYISLNEKEIEKFKILSDKWSASNTEFSLLRLLNPVRLQYITKHVEITRGLKILDVGCGGGILSLVES